MLAYSREVAIFHAGEKRERSCLGLKLYRGAQKGDPKLILPYSGECVPTYGRVQRRPLLRNEALKNGFGRRGRLKEREERKKEVEGECGAHAKATNA